MKVEKINNNKINLILKYDNLEIREIYIKCIATNSEIDYILFMYLIE